MNTLDKKNMEPTNRYQIQNDHYLENGCNNFDDSSVICGDDLPKWNCIGVKKKKGFGYTGAN